MLVYEGLKSDFQNAVNNATIATEIEQKILEKMGRHTQPSEFNSWINSLTHMNTALTDSDIPSDAGIAIEYNIPLSAKRVDFIITGYDSHNKPGMVIIELKQWQKLDVVDSTKTIVSVDESEHDSLPRVRTFTGNAFREVVHPSYQAWSYAQLIADYNEVVQKQQVHLAPCAYLHNYVRKNHDPLDHPQFEPFITYSPAFTYSQVGELREFIKKWIKKGDNKEILYRVDHGKIKPSKSLQDAIASMIEGNDEFTMIDEQQVVFENIIKLSDQSKSDQKKRTIICKGGPGTGKSVIAVRLLAELTQKGHNQFIQYVSKNSAPRQVYATKLKGASKKVSIYNMFKGSGSYTDVAKNFVDTLLVDEAHRLNEKSGMFHNKGENQIKEIIHASKCSVFFIDERQRVTIDDIGSVAEIRKWAEAEGSEVTELELVSQFRCNGSNGYLAWIDNLLEIRQSANYNLDGVDYDVRILDTPEEVRQLIIEKNKISNRSRILAGYCWNWPKETRNDTNYHDIQIGDFGISWNLEGDSAFAISENSVNEAGCIHTTQGLEFDYVGVIIGDDLQYKDGHVITDATKRASTDSSLKGIKKLSKENPMEAKKIADELIKNTYRTLLTRGMKGCYIYCTNPELREHIRGRLTTSSVK